MMYFLTYSIFQKECHHSLMHYLKVKRLLTAYTLVNITSKLIFPQSSNIYAYFCKLNTFVFMVGNLTRVLMHAVQQKIAYYIYYVNKKQYFLL